MSQTPYIGYDEVDRRPVSVKYDNPTPVAGGGRWNTGCFGTLGSQAQSTRQHAKGPHASPIIKNDRNEYLMLAIDSHF